MTCQPWPSSGPVVFRPGTCYSSPPAASWWTFPHIALAAVVALWAAIILAFLAALIRDTLIRPSRDQITAWGWFRLPEAERDWRAAEFRAADEALQINGEAEDMAGVTEETETYHLLNSRVNDLWGTVPWWCRR